MVDPDNDGNIWLHYAAASGDIEMIDSFVNEGYDLNTQNNQGQTPLHIAYKHGNVEAALRLIQRGALINMKDKAGKVPFDYDASGL